MDPNLQTTPHVECSTVGKLSSGTWALTEIKHGSGDLMVPVLCLQQIPDEDATRVLILGGNLPGIYITRDGDTDALVLPGPVDAKFDPHTMHSRNMPNLESNPAVLLTTDSRGVLFVCPYYVSTRPLSSYPAAVRINTLEMVDIPNRCFWTDEFTLRIYTGRVDEWIETPQSRE